MMREEREIYSMLEVLVADALELQRVALEKQSRHYSVRHCCREDVVAKIDYGWSG